MVRVEATPTVEFQLRETTVKVPENTEKKRKWTFVKAFQKDLEFKEFQEDSQEVHRLVNRVNTFLRLDVAYPTLKYLLNNEIPSWFADCFDTVVLLSGHDYVTCQDFEFTVKVSRRGVTARLATREVPQPVSPSSEQTSRRQRSISPVAPSSRRRM